MNALCENKIKKVILTNTNMDGNALKLFINAFKAGITTIIKSEKMKLSCNKINYDSLKYFLKTLANPNLSDKTIIKKIDLSDN